jgi:hypothetical protein
MLFHILTMSGPVLLGLHFSVTHTASVPANGHGLRTHKYGYTVICMKTTVELPDELLIAAKKRAADLRRPLRVLIERGLRHELEAPNGPQKPKARRKPKWVTVDGGLPKGLDVSDRSSMHAWIAGGRKKDPR